MLIDATHSEETRVVVVDGTKVEEFDFETVNKRQLAGNIYLAKVTRVEPSLQAAFVDYGGNRHGFLAFAEIHPDYYQIPAADRRALIEEERQAAAAESEEAEKPKRNGRRRKAPKAAAADNGDAVAVSDDIPGMTIVDTEAADTLLEDETAGNEPAELAVQEAAPIECTPEEAAAAAEAAADDHAEDAGEDDGIESIAEEDVTEEIRAPKRPRARRYKIQEVIKVRQIMLVQVVKEERGNKGAALTTYLSLAGRYCVLMPNTARGGGISRKITNAADRKKLKEIASELEVPEGAGLIIRTAGSQRTRTEIRRDYEYLMRLWEQIRELTFKSIAPAPVYEEGDLIKRTIRDIYSKEIDEVLVEGERGYRTAKDFMKMIMPSHAKNVKHYTDQMPLYARFQVESYLGGMFNPTVQLKSGGYIVIGVTEALVAIDVNSGRATKEGSIEDTALKTNLEAAEEIARQLRLRDLAGLIVVDFIDMEERKNNAAVEKRFKDKLKTDRARIQVGRISGFGLLEMSRQRLRPGMLESTTQPCPHCHGTGLIRSDDSLALTILRAIEEEGTRKRSREVLVKAPIAVANFLMNAKREHIAGIEARYGMSVRVEADPTLISPDFAIEKFKTATRNVPEVVSPVVSVDARLMAQIDDEEVAEEEDDIEEAVEAEAEDSSDEARSEAGEQGENGGKTRRRRRRRRRGGKNGEGEGENGDEAQADAGDAAEVEVVAEITEAAPAEVAAVDAGEEDAKPRRRTRSRRRKSDDAEAAAESVAEPVAIEAVAETSVETAEIVDLSALPVSEPAQIVAEEPAEETAVAEAAPEVVAEIAAEVVVAEVQPEPAVAPEIPASAAPAQIPEPELAEAEDTRPKRRGWWSLG
ncbi:RNAse E [Paracoccus lutimaris]|uniref:Ribonuclease E n=2 Tax=Paracoccus lutimaris TaxID=1490030 RepID=A0A368YRB3_9RHOB|nr:RNAse E [Paracoccus lutimaris]